MATAFQSTEKQRGSTTAEFAVALPAVVFILALVLGATATGILQLRLEEGARLGARAAARGEDSQVVTRIVHDVEPEATVTIGYQDKMTRVSVSRSAPGLVGRISGWQLTADALALTEHTVHRSGTP